MTLSLSHKKERAGTKWSRVGKKKGGKEEGNEKARGGGDWDSRIEREREIKRKRGREKEREGERGREKGGGREGIRGKKSWLC